MDLKPYQSVKPMMGPLDSWLTGEDAERLQAYAIYEAMYRNLPDAFTLVKRGDEQNPIYIPSGKTILEAKNRYLAKDWTFALDSTLGTDAERLTLKTFLTNLFRREKVWSKFATQKRWGMIRGDSVWHITVDEEKEDGKKISIHEADPASYFPIDDPWDPDKILGVHLVDPVVNADGKTVIKRQTYRKEDDGVISYELSWWETGAWDDREMSGQKLKKAEAKDIPEGEDNKPDFYDLPSEITSIPVYHIRNSPLPASVFGQSEFAGLEPVFQGINQAISDEDLTLAMQGLGLYWTNSGPPLDDDDNETNWKFGPGWVLEIDKDSEFGRVQGVNTVEPSLAHIAKLEQAARESSGVPDIAIGSVDVQTAESGIALAFKMSPILSGNAEKELEILGTMDQMLYDLVTMWLPAFEGINTSARAVSTVGDPLPVNRKATIDEVVALLSTDPPLVSTAWAQAYLADKLGFDFPNEMLDDIAAEAKAYAEARNVDPFASRAVTELEAE